MRHSFTVSVTFDRDIKNREAQRLIRLALRAASAWAGEEGSRTENRITQVKVSPVGER